VAREIRFPNVRNTVIMNCKPLLFGGALGLLAISSGWGQNLLTNGSFEDGLQDWGNAKPAIFEVTAGDAADGSHFVYIQSPDDSDNAIRRVLKGLTPGEDYTLTVYTRKNTIPDLRIILRNPETKKYIGLLKPLPSDDWQPVSRTFKAPGEAVGVEISTRAPGECQVDNVSVVAGISAPQANPSSGPSSSSAGSSPRPDKKEPFADQIGAFEAFDKVNPAAPGGTLFVGSSTIKRWRSMAKYFPDVRVINRGFGGARMRDVLYYEDRIVLPSKPAHILVYAGDNDLAAKGTPEEVLADFKTFVAKAHAAQPGIPITYISIKPSPHRTRIATKTEEANRLIAEYVKTDPSLAYVDITQTMLGPDGKPDPALFEADGLHINEEGYRRFAEPIQKRIADLSTKAAPQP
jgi:lysophospholipase L1-like esterase